MIEVKKLSSLHSKSCTCSKWDWQPTPALPDTRHLMLLSAASNFCEIVLIFSISVGRKHPLVHDDGHLTTILCSSVTWDADHLCSRRCCLGKICSFPIYSANTDLCFWCHLWKTRCYFWVWPIWTTSVHTSTCIEKSASKEKRKFAQYLKRP